MQNTLGNKINVNLLFEFATTISVRFSEKRRKHFNTNSDRTVFSMEWGSSVVDTAKRTNRKGNKEN